MAFALAIIGAFAMSPSVIDLSEPPKIVKLPVFPTPAVSDGVWGRVTLRLVVDPQGTVRSCLLTASSGLWALDVSSCETVMASARFAPSRERADRRFTARFRWGLIGGAEVRGVTKLISPRIGELEDGDQIPAGTLSSVCRNDGDVTWCDALPAAESTQFEVASKGSLRLAMANGTRRFLGYELTFPAATAWQATDRIVYFHGSPCYTDHASGTLAWVAGSHYLLKVGGRFIAGRPGLAPELDLASKTCPPLAPVE